MSKLKNPNEAVLRTTYRHRQQPVTGQAGNSCYRKTNWLLGLGSLWLGMQELVRPSVDQEVRGRARMCNKIKDLRYLSRVNIKAET